MADASSEITHHPAAQPVCKGKSASNMIRNRRFMESLTARLRKRTLEYGKFYNARRAKTWVSNCCRSDYLCSVGAGSSPCSDRPAQPAMLPAAVRAQWADDYRVLSDTEGAARTPNSACNTMTAAPTVIPISAMLKAGQ